MVSAAQDTGRHLGYGPAMLTRLKIHHFRDVVPGTELRFGPGFNVLLGVNGTGKTTLLNLISAVLRGDFSSLRGEAFAVEYELGVGLTTFSATFTATLRHEPPRTTHAPRNGPAELGESITGADRITARIHHRDPTLGEQSWLIEGGSLGLRFVRDDGKTTISQPISLTEPGLLWKLPMALYKSQECRVYQYFGFSECYRFDESLGVMAAMVGEGGDGVPGASIVVPLSELQRGTNFFGLGTFLDGEIEAGIQADLRRNPDADRFILMGASLPFLATAVAALGFVSAECWTSVSERRVRGEETELEFNRFTYVFRRKDRSFVNHEHLSYGQKRMVSFFYYLSVNFGPIVADEIVNGLHHRWIETCVEAMRGRQAFLTSQNPVLLDCLGFESAKQVAETFILCRTVEEGDATRMSWRNMPEEDAADFFEAYNVGIQYASEILRTRGWW